ncbi:MAG: hypothetical protein U0Y82_00785 [Thermoleophilia bacterium]
MAQPRCLILIRHGEKPAHGDGGVDEDGTPDDHGLTPRGWQRAGALAAVCGRAAADPGLALPRPAALVAPAYDHGVHRSPLTLLPLARVLGLEVRSPFEADAEPGHIADWLVALPDEIVMVCWEHSSLPGIARAVGERASVANATDIPGVWPDDRFDLIWRFDLDSGATARFSIAAQQLLWGDAPA